MNDGKSLPTRILVVCTMGAILAVTALIWFALQFGVYPMCALWMALIGNNLLRSGLQDVHEEGKLDELEKLTDSFRKIIDERDTRLMARIERRS